MLETFHLPTDAPPLREGSHSYKSFAERTDHSPTEASRRMRLACHFLLPNQEADCHPQPLIDSLVEKSYPCTPNVAMATSSQRRQNGMHAESLQKALQKAAMTSVQYWFLETANCMAQHTDIPQARTPCSDVDESSMSHTQDLDSHSSWRTQCSEQRASRRRLRMRTLGAILMLHMGFTPWSLEGPP